MEYLARLLKMKKNLVLIVLAIFIVEISFVAAQNNDSGFQYHRTAILNGNQVKTVFGNWGVIGQPATSGSRGAWIYPKNGYIGDVSPLVGAEVNGKYLYNGMTRDTTFRWVIDTPVERPSGQKDFDDNRMRRAFEPVSGYFNPNQGKPAMSNDENSWPEIWPDKANDAEDPGWPGVWNGLFGKFASADLETFFVMDDDADN